MKKFLFSLETLLRHRKYQEEKERTSLTWLQAGLHREAALRQQLQELQTQACAELNEAASAKIESADLDLSRRYLDRLSREIKQSQQRLAKLDADVREQRKAVMVASKKTKVLDGLKGKRLRQHMVDVERAEQKTVDEMVIARLGRNDN